MGIIKGDDKKNTLLGTGLKDTIYGYGGDDTVFAGGGDDTIYGGTGNDTMHGGTGSDTYFVDSQSDKVVELAGEGDEDIIVTSVTFNIAANVENMFLTGSGDIDAYGNSLDNFISGNSGDNDIYGGGGNDELEGGAGNDKLFGGTGNDEMTGGAGDDTYSVDSHQDKVIEHAGNGSGKDTVVVSVDGYWLDDNVENLTLIGAARVGHGNDLDNTIIGNALHNDLYGGAGNDTMIGGDGIDIYIVEDEGDVVVELANEGDADAVLSTVSRTLEANVEQLWLSGTANLFGIGNDLDNRITGNDGNNLLEGKGGDDTILGGLGADTMYGGSGNDWFFVDNVGDKVIEYAGDGDSDGIVIIGDLEYSLMANSHVENLALDKNGHAVNATGNALSNRIWGNNDDNVIDGRGGADKMFGLDGNDTYYVDHKFDYIFEDDGKGNDTVFSTVDYTLAEFVETLSLDGGTAVSGTGNAQANSIYGNSGNNVLNGAGGADSLSGLGGNDTFVFMAGEANGDSVYEFAGNGAGNGDVLEFHGYGTAAQGATLMFIGGDTWQINSADGTVHETIHLIGTPMLDASDYVFV